MWWLMSEGQGQPYYRSVVSLGSCVRQSARRTAGQKSRRGEVEHSLRWCVQARDGHMHSQGPGPRHGKVGWRVGGLGEGGVKRGGRRREEGG